MFYTTKNTIRTLIYSIITSILWQPVGLIAEELTSATQPKISYTSLATFFPTPLEVTSTSKKTETSYLEYEKQATLSIHEKRKMAFELLGSSEQEVETDATTANLLRELEVFSNRNGSVDTSVFATLNKTSTIFGEVFLAHMLANPLHDAKALAERQAIIRLLIDNEELFTTLETALLKAKKAEDGFLSFVQKSLEQQKEEAASKKSDPNPSLFNKTVQYALKPVTSTIRYVQTSPLFQEGLQRFEDCWTPAMLLSSLYAAQWANNRLRLTQSLLDGSTAQLKATNDNVIETTHWREFNPFAYKAIYQELVAKLMQQNLSYYQAQEEALRNTVILGLSKIGTLLNFSITTYSFIKAIKFRNAEINTLHQTMNDTATIVATSKTIATALEKERVLGDAVTTKEVLARFFDSSSNHDLSNLLAYFKTKTFETKPSYFSYRGRVSVANTLSYEQVTTLLSVMQTIGEIDAYLSIARLYKEARNDTVSYTLAAYEMSNTPSLSLQGFWHPLIDKKSVVTNDLMLGACTNNNGVILTGSNTGGKSTVLKSVLLSILLAQTFTIAPATEVTITPCALLGSYLSVSDNIAEGNSLFKAEVLRAKDLLTRVHMLQPTDVAFVVIDELFTGTAADKGAAAAQKVADALASKDNLAYILATHFSELTSLEESTHGRCKNYQIDVLRHNDGTITRPFKLHRGISTTNIANDLLQEELVDLTF